MKRLELVIMVVVGFFNRLLDEIRLYRERKSKQQQADEIERLRNDPQGYWQHFDTHGIADDVRLSDVAREGATTAAATADRDPG